ncbi:hypothetical protein HUJ04_009960 [Dendroctonus ponderosae]|nr:hypothetical protein HUJ04_009960 [Dendroctonus ponderosae]
MKIFIFTLIAVAVQHWSCIDGNGNHIAMANQVYMNAFFKMSDTRKQAVLLRQVKPGYTWPRRFLLVQSTLAERENPLLMTLSLAAIDSMARRSSPVQPVSSPSSGLYVDVPDSETFSSKRSTTFNEKLCIIFDSLIDSSKQHAVVSQIQVANQTYGIPIKQKVVDLFEENVSESGTSTYKLDDGELTGWTGLERRAMESIAAKESVIRSGSYIRSTSIAIYKLYQTKYNGCIFSCWTGATFMGGSNEPATVSYSAGSLGWHNKPFRQHCANS